MKTIVRTSLDYGPREEQSEDRLNCRTVLKTVCEDLTAKDWRCVNSPVRGS